jgi:alpha-D-ribose 1-methylphosphonate 5-triphosphate diphosphatase PhnM
LYRPVAKAVGLADRGKIAVGKLADLIRALLAGDIAAVRSL